MCRKSFFVVVIGLTLLALLLSGSRSAALGPVPESPQSPQAPLGAAFTYQGQLKNASGPVTGMCDMAFRLYDDGSVGSQVGNAITTTVPITNGLFTVTLNGTNEFSTSAFNGDARWLQISVKCPSDPSFVPLTPRQALTPAPYALALPGLWTQQNITSTNLIGGYSGNSVTSGKVGAAIGGGGNSAFPNSVTADYGTVSGGEANTSSGLEATVGGGFGNTASGQNSTVSGGWGNVASNWHTTVSGGLANTASGNKATIGGGHNNVASGFLATIGGGYSNTASYNDTAIGGGVYNTASGDKATVPGGYGAAASHYGEMAYASGWFGYSGDAQTSVYVLRRQTNDASQMSLFLDGQGTTQRLTIAPGRALAFEVLVVARSNSGASAGYRIWGVIGNSAGTTTMIGASGQVLGEDPSAISWDAIAEADDINDAVDIRVTGAASTLIHWVAVVRTVEVAW